MMTIEQRFWNKVGKHSDQDACWLWLGSSFWVGKAKYGQFKVSSHNTVLVHRFSYELLVGLIPWGLEIDHLCRNTLCVNLKHLEPVTHQVNCLRGFSPWAVYARRTHCKQGHVFTEGSNYIDHNRRRICKICEAQLVNY